NTRKYILILSMTPILLGGCTSYKIDISDMPEEQVQQNKTALNENLEKHDAAIDPAEKVGYAEEIGFRYMILGEYDKAISYYKEVLEYDNAHYPALTNIAVMYEEVGEIKKALEYEKRLYEGYPDYLEVNGDLIRLLLADGQVEEATKVIDTLANAQKGQENPSFIKEQNEAILNYNKN
ncbi:MAG: tetratricopeptide repeat protein, partial [bacterium]